MANDIIKHYYDLFENIKEESLENASKLFTKKDITKKITTLEEVAMTTRKGLALMFEEGLSK